MLTVKEYIKNQKHLLANYRAFLKKNVMPYGHEKRLIDEIKRIDKNLQSMRFIDKTAQIYPQDYLTIESKINAKNQNQN